MLLSAQAAAAGLLRAEYRELSAGGGAWHLGVHPSRKADGARVLAGIRGGYGAHGRRRMEGALDILRTSSTPP